MTCNYIYLCGPTVYDEVHIGNLRPIITFDIFIRARRFNNENIYFIHNITDIDDKIIIKAKKEKVTEDIISSRYFKFYLEQLVLFNITSVDEFPSVINNMKEIISFISLLNGKNFTYQNNTGIYFDVIKDKSYGNISGNKLKDLISQDKKVLKKENEQDFCLWKLNKNLDEKCFFSEFGKGRPGWHTECSAFIYKITNGNQLDIHGGGVDLKFPHHENENAQFRAITGKEIAKKWIHIGIVNLNGKKMSKSENNLLFAREYLDYDQKYLFNQDVLRLIFLNSNYKATINFDNNLYNQNKKLLNSYLKIKKILLLRNSFNEDVKLNKNFKEIIIFFSSLENAKGLTILNTFIKEFNKTKDHIIGNQIIYIFKILGFKFVEYKLNPELLQTYDLWQKELSKKNFKEADKYREVLIKEDLI